MHSQLRSQVVFRVTGRQGDPAVATALPSGLRPALLAPYRRLLDLRHDYPVVLVDGTQEYAVSLTTVVDGALRAVAPEGPSGEAMRKRALQLETRIRHRVAAGERGRLGAMWRRTAAESCPATDADSYERDMATVLGAFAHDGELADCDVEVPARFVRHAWKVVQRDKARSALARIEALTIRLEAILRADDALSPAALAGPSLRASFGPVHGDLFDFTAMSRLLSSRGPRGGLSAQRRHRIETALASLRTQRFFPATDEENDALEAQFVFDTAGTALDAFLQRLPEMVALHRALHVAELEADGLYAEEIHDAILLAIDESSLGATDLQFFPDFLVCASRSIAGPSPALLEALSASVPIKVLVQLDDLLEPSLPGRTRFASGLRGAQVGMAAMSLGDTFVLQTAASNLVQMRDAVQRGLRHTGPALFAIHAGPPRSENGVPSYLVAAAACQSRALPSFVYDPALGPCLADRFSLANNPQVERDWPVEPLTYADANLQAVTEEVAFTAVDFALCDPRYAAHFAVVQPSDWSDSMIPAARWLHEPPVDPTSAVPYVVAVDESDLLCRLVVDEQLVRAALRCREGWHRLQELGGVHDSRLERALALERESVAPQSPGASVATSHFSSGGAPASEPEVRTAGPAVETARDPDVACIETLRCSSCNECTLAFPKMFAYNDDKQAFIRDVRAGTYRQLVEAAESCQVSVIHPGKPWNPDEPGLDELLERARPFM